MYVSHRCNVVQIHRTETIYTDLESFSNHPQNASNIPDVQDGYGLMISELLGNDFSNCSSVQADMNTMHNNIGLPNEEVQQPIANLIAYVCLIMHIFPTYVIV